MRRLPHAKVVPMLHYAHREGGEIEARELLRIRELLSLSAEEARFEFKGVESQEDRFTMKIVGPRHKA